MKKEVMDFICDLHGYLIRLKEIHWSTEKNSIHKICDEIMDDLRDAEDEFAEAAMGLYNDKVKVGDLKPYLPDSEELMGMLKELEKETLEMKKSLTEDDEAALVNVLDDMLTFTNKYKYRVTQL